MARSRLIGEYPVIGIRPTIDGRRGKIKVRESLEDQTMNMAKSAAKLIEENVFYSNGEHVKVIIADTTIGRVAEAAACEDKFKKAGVDITLTVTPCWCYGAETMDMNPLTIKAVWGFNGTERPGAVYLASVLATHAQKGLPAFGIYGHEVQEADDTTIPQDSRARGGSGCHDAGQIVSANRLGNDGHRRLDYFAGVFRRVPRHAGRKRRRSGNYPPNGEGHLRRERVSESLEMGERKMQARFR